MEVVLKAWIGINVVFYFIFLGALADTGANFSFVNPNVIYKKLEVNWFGAWLLAIVCNVVLPAVAIPYWIYKACTVGRN